MKRLANVRGRLSAAGWALLPIRFIIGYGFAAHGYAKLSRGVEGFAGILAAMHVPSPEVVAWVTTLLELVGGVAMVLGAFVVPLSLPLAAVMLTALFGVHLQYGFSSVKLLEITGGGARFGPTGYELNLLYLAGLLTLVLGGTTPLSVDRLLDRRRKGRNR
jgi:putative oxidoreductase